MMADSKKPDDKVVPITKKPTKKTTTKKTKQPTKKERDALRAKHVKLARDFIFKNVKQKPVAQNFSQHPYVPSGSSMVDDLIGGSPAQDGSGPVCPGYPRRRITELFGAESSGKTTLALEAVCEVQKLGGWAMFIDFEHALHHGYAKAIGVDFSEDKLLLYAPDTFEEGMRMLYTGIHMGADLIVVDSIAAMVTKDELNKPIGDPARIGALAREMSDKLPKIGTRLWRKNDKNPLGTAIIFINQTRAKIGGKGGTNTAGGRALKFYAYIRIEVRRVKTESVEKKDPFTGRKKKFPYGNQVKVTILKSKMDAKQGHDTEIFIRYGRGIDEFLSIIEAGAAHGVISKSGAWLEYNETKVKGREKFRAFLENNPKVFNAIRAEVLKSVQAASIEAPPEPEDDESNLMAELDEEFGASDEAPDIGVDE